MFGTTKKLDELQYMTDFKLGEIQNMDDTLDVSKLRVTGKRVLVRMCYNPDITDSNGKVLIVLPDKTKNYTHWAELIGVGNRCKLFRPEHVGMLVHVDEGGDGYHYLGDGPDTGGYWFIDEDKLDPVVYQ